MNASSQPAPRNNGKTALALLSLALVFFASVIVNRVWLG